MESHRMRVGALAWSSSLLSSGSRDKTILHHDIRAQEDYVSKLTGHKSEVSYSCLLIMFFLPCVSLHRVSDDLSSVSIIIVKLHVLSLIMYGIFQVCGLKWSYDNRQLASGGNDNRVRCLSICFHYSAMHYFTPYKTTILVCQFYFLSCWYFPLVQLFVWNPHSVQPVLKYTEHTAAVKAIAWSPHLHGLLASGGGTADRCIRFWNTTTNTHLSCVDTGSQVVFNVPIPAILVYLPAHC